MNFTLKIMGTASAMPVVGRSQSAQVLEVHERFFLIDCGEGVQHQMLKYRVPIMKLDSIFISHIHGDHIFGIFGLLSTLGMKGRVIPLTIYAAPDFGPLLKFFLSYFGEGLSFEIRFVPLSMKTPEVVYSTKTLEVLAFPLNHRIDTFGFLFREKEPQFNVKKEYVAHYNLSLTEIGTLKRGEDVVREDEIIPASLVTYKPYEPRSYAYVSDSSPFEGLASWVKGVDILYHEATYPKEFEDQAALRYHSTTIQAATCAKQAGVRKLVIGHYSSRVRDAKLYQDECRTVFEESYAAADGDVYDIPLIKQN